MHADPRGTCTSDARSEVGTQGFTLACLSEQGARFWPDATAVIAGSEQVSFAALHRATEQLAYALAEHGVGHGDRVVVLGGKDIVTLITILSVARAGGIYVPVDPNQPTSRLRFVLDDCAPRLVIGPESLRMLAAPRAFVPLSSSVEALAQGSAVPRALPRVAPEDIAYMLYTSGSTGRPKGVLIEHRGVHAFFLAHNERARIEAGDRCMNTGPFHFDVSVIDVLLPLYCGACVVLTPELPLPKLLLHTLARERVTHFYAVGSILALMTGDGRALDGYDLSALRMLQTGAEVCNPRVVNQWLRRLPHLRFLNSYGPTELTVGCACFVKSTPGLLPEDNVPIGMLHEGSVGLLLDARGAVIEDAVAEGELVVGGAQVMRGYFARPDEEQRAFIMHAGARFYRTGDIVRRDACGLLHYVGRRDHEVKIDGCRVHLSETLRALRTHAAVQAAAVGTVRDRRGRLRVGAAVTLARGADIDLARGLVRHLAQELPAAFVPAGLLVRAELPRSSTGKTDTALLMARLERCLSLQPAQAIFFDVDGAGADEQTFDEAAAE